MIKVISEEYNILKQDLTRLNDYFFKYQFNLNCLKDSYFLSKIKELEYLVNSKKYSSFSQPLFETSFFTLFAKSFRKYYSLYEVFLETDKCLSLIQGETDLMDDNFKPMFEFAKKEAELAKIDKNSKVLFAGSGSFPESAISYALKIGCQVTCIDYNVESVCLSQKLINKLNLQDKISIIYANALDFDYKNYTHIVIAALCTDKQNVLKRICTTSNNSTSIICRNVEGLKKLLYEPIGEFYPEHFKFQAFLPSFDNTIIHSILLHHNNHNNFIVTNNFDSKLARQFCLNMIKETYGFEYRKDWHSDLDSLLDKNGMYSIYNNGDFVVILDGDKIVASGGLRDIKTKPELYKQFSSRYKNKKIGSIWRVYVHPDYRKKGLATRIVNYLENKAIELGYELLYLHTSKVYPIAINFWNSLNYKTFLEEDTQDLVVHMEKEISHNLNNLNSCC